MLTVTPSATSVSIYRGASGQCGEIVTSRIDAILAFDRTAELSRITTPALIVGAQDDIITPHYFAEELARLIPGAEVKIFPQGGHCFTQVMPRDFNHAVLRFLKAHTPA